MQVWSSIILSGCKLSSNDDDCFNDCSQTNAKRLTEVFVNQIVSNLM